MSAVDTGTMRRRGLLGLPLLPELVLLALAAAAFFLFPFELSFLSRMAVMMILVISVDLVVGYARVVTLGQSALYGAGAYAAGLFAIFATAEPLLGLVAGTAAGALVAALSGLLILRLTPVVLLVVSILFAQFMAELVRQGVIFAGLPEEIGGLRTRPILGLVPFDFIGQTAFWYAVALLLAVLVFVQRLTASPFGLSVSAAGRDPERAEGLGISPFHRRLAIYIVAGALAGLAGALTTQITGRVGPEVFGFSLSLEALVFLAIGGAGRVWGAVLGTALVLLLQRFSPAGDTVDWYLVLGFLLLLVAFFARRGLIGLPAQLARCRETAR